MWKTMWKVRTPSKICVDNSVENLRNFPHYQHRVVKNYRVHSLYTGYSQGYVDNQYGSSVGID